MTEVKEKEFTEEQFEKPDEIEPTIDNKIELMRFFTKVQSSLKEDITEDFVLAKLKEKDKQGIIQMTSNAYFSKRIMDILKKVSIKKWGWDKTNQKWIKVKRSDEELEIIENYGKMIFNTYMTEICMTTILNRNVDKNHMLQIITGYKEEETSGRKIDEIKDTMKSILEPEE